MAGALFLWLAVLTVMLRLKRSDRRLLDAAYVGAAGDRSRADVQGEFVSTNSSAAAAPEAPQRGSSSL